jgi:acetolactate synthase-1/2/3 large subunit
MPTVTEALVQRLADENVRHIFGVPGGECNLDFIAAGEAAGMTFVLTRTETAAVIMASVSAELTGNIGVAMTTRGPGIAAAANGVAYAQLDRAPVLVIADGYEDDQGHISHQRIDQVALMEPLTKGAGQISDSAPLAQLDGMLATMRAAPPGPAYLEVSGSRIRKPVGEAPVEVTPHAVAASDAAALDAARAMLAGASRPVVIAGLQARHGATPKLLQAFLEKIGCPYLYTYKAKGVVSDDHPQAIGPYIGGVAEESAIRSADLIILFGFDPVEGPPQPWRYDLPLLEITQHAFDHPLLNADVSVVGDIDTSLERLTNTAVVSTWQPAQLRDMKQLLAGKARVTKGAGISPQDVVDEVHAAMPETCRITVDAGAHMLPVMHLWNARHPNSALISRGLSTMAFALPAAIASCLTDPDTPVVAFTGDGGLMMCAGELATAVQFGAKPILVVFNDSSLTLIGAKQRRRQLANAGVDFSSTNFAEVARGFGWADFRVTEASALRAAVVAAVATGRATLIDVVIDPSEYHDQIAALRG